MTIKENIGRLSPHLIGWGALLLVILLQNDLSDWEFEDYYSITGLIVFIGIAVYINLYFLIPRYLFLKKYLHYGISVSILILSTSLLITIWMSKFDQIDWVSRFIVLVINVLFSLLMTSAGKFLFEYLQKMIKLKEIENKQLQSELNILKSQVNPHFLFNTLNNLYGLITQNENQKAAEITLKLAELTRYLLESSKTEKISIKRELQFIEDYLCLEKIRFRNNTEIKFDISGIDKEVFVAPLLFIPLVENAFKHGLQTVTEKSFAHFSLAIQGDDLFFEARNSIGKKIQNHSTSGTGITNLKKRLQLIYPEKHQLDIENTANFYKVTLHLEL
jgi:LytS/YehU family sensor histidine kinase